MKECCGGVLWSRGLEKFCREVLEKSVVENCWRTVL